MKSSAFFFIAICIIHSACGLAQAPTQKTTDTAYPIHKAEAEWKALLDAKQYHVLREKGTERAFSGMYNKHNEKGIYHCAACNAALFSSETKFDSGTGWPSFYDVVPEGNVKEIEDRSFGMRRIEVVCAQCGGHLGHVFPDGPKPTGLRYCINSVSLDFTPRVP